MKKIVVTGASGFLGSNLCKIISDYELIKVYNNTKIENGWYCDLNNKESVKMLLNKSDPDIIIHCAANSKAKHPEDYKQFLEDHITSTVNLLENCKPRTKFIYISSVLIFGNKVPMISPTNLYGACKLSCENFCRVYGLLKDLEIVIIRPCAIVGPNMTHGLLFDIDKKLKSDSETLELWGKDPGSIKPFVHVKDVCEAIKHSIENNINLPLNLFPQDSISVRQVAEITMDCLNIKKEIVWNPDKTWVGDNSFIDTSNQQYLFLKTNSIEAIRRCFNET